MIWEGCTCSCQDNTCFFHLCYDFLCAAWHRIKANKVTALRVGPLCDIQSAKIFFHDGNQCFKLRTNQICMFLHMCFHSFIISKETNMAQLIYLIMADSLNCHLLFDGSYICSGGCECCHTRTWEYNLRCRYELIYHIWISCLLTLIKNV